MALTVLQIVGTSFCGSSLLNALLDTQDGIVALGEVHRVCWPRSQDFYCLRCHTDDPLCCAFYRDFVNDGMDATDVYSYAARRSGCNVLVDTSKSWFNVARMFDRRYDIHAVVLSKSPHESAFSHRTHHGDMSMRECFRQYLLHYIGALRAFEMRGNPVICVQYASLAKDFRRQVRYLCGLCGITCDERALESRLFSARSHSIRGNPAVIAQMMGNREFFSKHDKYHGRLGEIFLDEAWKGDASFLRECLALYEEGSGELDQLLARLGHRTCAALAEDVRRALMQSCVVA